MVDVKTMDEMLELDTIYNEDCLEGMKQIPDGTIDAVICDLPYGTTGNAWDTIIPLDKLWEQYKRVIKPNSPIILFAQQPFASVLGCSNLGWLKYEWIWEKNKASNFLHAKHSPMKCHENILVFYRDMPTYNPQMRKGEPYKIKRGPIKTPNYFVEKKDTETINEGIRYPQDIIEFSSEFETIHPTQKPVDLLRYLVLTYTNEGDTVLDLWSLATRSALPLATVRTQERDARRFSSTARRGKSTSTF